MEKSIEELLEEFLDNGGEIEVVPPEETEDKQTIGSTTKKPPQIMTLPEGEFMFGKKQKKRKKAKKPDFSKINLDLIPDHLKKLLKINENKKEEQVETNKNTRSASASDER